MSSMNSYGHFCRPAMVPLLEHWTRRHLRQGRRRFLYSNRRGRPWFAPRHARGLCRTCSATIIRSWSPRPTSPRRQSPRSMPSLVPGRRGQLAGVVPRLGDYRRDVSRHSGTERFEAAIKHVPSRAAPGRCSGRSRAASTARRSGRSSSRGPKPAAVRHDGPAGTVHHDPLDPADLDAACANIDDCGPPCYSSRSPAKAGSSRCPRRSRHACVTCAPDTTFPSSPTDPDGMGRTGTFLASESPRLESRLHLSRQSRLAAGWPKSARCW